MCDCKVFISYSHVDEWLKDELIKHLAAMKRSGHISIWHDRMIPAGGILNNEIDANLSDCNLFLMLISPDFIHSEYCFKVEYHKMLSRYDNGEATIVPIIVRDCDWDVDRLKSFAVLPPDAIPVTRNAVSKSDTQERDQSWTKVAEGLKPVIESLKKKLSPPNLLENYVSHLFVTDNIKHQLLSIVDERLLQVDPEIFFENSKEQISSFDRVMTVCLSYQAIIIIGSDRSGKTLTAKRLQAEFDAAGYPAVFLKGDSIQNADIMSAIKVAINNQYGKVDFPISRFTVIIDDFDECRLRDKNKEQIIETLCSKVSRCILVSFSNAPSVLFTSRNLPDPATMKINPINDNKAYGIVKKWKQVTFSDGQVDDEVFLRTFERIQYLVGQTELDQYPSTVLMFLQLLDTASGSDLSFSSYAACYDTMISTRLSHAGIQWTSIDESKNFLALLAYSCYSCDEAGYLPEEKFLNCISIYEDQFLSSGDKLRESALLFMNLSDGKYIFKEDYIWYFLCARYVANVLSQNDRGKYLAFVATCTENIFLKKYANIVIYIAYFSRECDVLLSLLNILDGLFSKAENWVLSDDSREIIHGISSHEHNSITANADVSANRESILQGKVADIINNAEKVVASYTLPFLRTAIDDSEYIENIESREIDADSYMRSVNALLRTHSIIGQILNSRSGTYKSDLILSCITRMVKASGRYVYLNHAIVTVLMRDKETSIDLLSEKGDKDYYDKLVRIFSFWSVYLSHAGLARYLSREHSIRALERLSEEYDATENKTEKNNIPFNFTLVSLIAKLYHSGEIDKVAIDAAIKKYGQNSALIALLRASVFIYTYYMPLHIEDKQWISNRLGIPLQRLELVGMKRSIGYPRPISLKN